MYLIFYYLLHSGKWRRILIDDKERRKAVLNVFFYYIICLVPSKYVNGA